MTLVATSLLFVMSKPEVLGIDAGNSQCTVSVFGASGLEIVAKCLSVVFINNGQYYIGKQALSFGSQNPKNVIYDIKLMLGRKTTDPTIAARSKDWGFKITTLKNGFIGVKIDDGKREEVHSVRQLWAHVLKEAVNQANSFLGKNIKKVIVSIPSDWEKPQRDEMEKALKAADLELQYLTDDMTAAAQAYMFRKQVVDKSTPAPNIIVFDFSATKMSLAHMQLSQEGKYQVVCDFTSYEVGGRTIDDDLVRKFLNILPKNSSLLSQERFNFRLRRECEGAKITLSTTPQAEIAMDGAGDEYYTKCVSEEVVKEFVDEIIRLCTPMAEKVKKNGICGELVCVGGGSNIPLLEKKLSELFGYKVCRNLTYQEVIARGLLSSEVKLKKEEPPITCPGVTCHIGDSEFHLQKNVKLPHWTCFSVPLPSDVVKEESRIKLSFEIWGSKEAQELQVPIPRVSQRDGIKFELQVTMCLTTEWKLKVQTYWKVSMGEQVFDFFAPLKGSDARPKTPRSSASDSDQDSSKNAGSRPQTGKQEVATKYRIKYDK